MKRLEVTSKQFLFAEEEFGLWLKTLGYTETTARAAPTAVREFFQYAEQQGVHTLEQIDTGMMYTYYHTHLKYRPNVRTGGGLSNNHLNKHIQALTLFAKYLRHSGKLILPPMHIRTEDPSLETVPVLTVSEVRELFAAADKHQSTCRCKAAQILPALALRDKAMLSLYYSCGLRLSEGIHVCLEDILWEKHCVIVRKGKNHTERLVPISPAGMAHLERYIKDGRPQFERYAEERTLILSERGRRLQQVSVSFRMRLLIARTANPRIQAKAPGIHTLRHSIATHLLESGMPLERIGRFLGHTTLESTQRYTHLLEQLNEEEA